MIRQSAFENVKKHLKGGLHCHTTRSDGKATPEETIAIHEQKGYDFLAITDHRIYNYKNYLPESRLTIIPGMEMDAHIAPMRRIHCFHTVWLGPEKPENPYEQDQVFERELVKDQFDFQEKYLNQAHKDKHLTIYCHPQWSGTPAREFEQMEGNFAMELWNTGCALGCDYDVNNGWIWDEILMQGKKIFGVATDDGHPATQHGMGWVMVNSESNVSSILEALKKGAFYSSTGPEIHDFYIDDEGYAHVKCSTCVKCRFICGAMRPIVQRGTDNGGAFLEMVSRDPVPDYFPYLRVEVTDIGGRVAWSNPIFLK